MNQIAPKRYQSIVQYIWIALTSTEWRRLSINSHRAQQYRKHQRQFQHFLFLYFFRIRNVNMKIERYTLK